MNFKIFSLLQSSSISVVFWHPCIVCTTSHSTPYPSPPRSPLEHQTDIDNNNTHQLAVPLAPKSQKFKNNFIKFFHISLKCSLTYVLYFLWKPHCSSYFPHYQLECRF